MHDVTEQVERMAMMLLLLAFGGALVEGLLEDVGWVEIGATALILLVVRPIAGLIGLLGSTETPGEKLAIAFFGIRGVGSFYYLAYALNHGQFNGEDQLWAIVSLVEIAVQPSASSAE